MSFFKLIAATVLALVVAHQLSGIALAKEIKPRQYKHTTCNTSSYGQQTCYDEIREIAYITTIGASLDSKTQVILSGLLSLSLLAVVAKYKYFATK